MAGTVMNKICAQLPINIIPLYFEPDGEFPSGDPNPMHYESRKKIEEKVREADVDFGVAWDGDADRCIFFDHNGDPVSGYFITALLAEMVLEKYPGGKIIHDPRLTWAVVDTVKEKGGVPIVSKVGSSLIRQRLRDEDAVFAGENSGHYYFKDNYYSDNGIIPFLLLLERLSQGEDSLAELVASYREKYHATLDEINMKIEDADTILEKLEEKYSDGEVTHVDGVSVEYATWRFNIRKSNTEPLVRLNVEAKSEEELNEKVAELKATITEFSG